MADRCGVAVIFVTRTVDVKEILICRAPNHKDAPNQWDLPKGHVEEGESTVLSAVRELYEETGLEVGPEALDFVANEVGQEKILHIFELDGDYIPEDFKFSCHSTFEWYGRELPEMVEWRWVPLTFAKNYLYKNLQCVVDKYLDMKGE